jgi:hypothetical protein
MDLEAAKHALRTAREAWHKAIDARDIKCTREADDEEEMAALKVESAIQDLQRFLPNYDPRANKNCYASDP